MKFLLLLMSVFLLLSGCSSDPEPVAPPESDPPFTETQPTTTEAPDPIQLLMESMSLEEQVGQLFLVRCNSETALEDIAAYHPGGFVLFGVDFDLHFRGPLSELKQAVDGGFFGEKIIGANITLNIRRSQEYYDENGKWRGTWALDGGGAFSNQGIHEIDRLITILGVPDEVRAFTATQTYDIEAEDYGSTQWRYANGTIAQFTVTTSYLASAWYCRVEVYGNQGAYLNVSGGAEGSVISWYSNGKWTEEAPFPYERQWQQGSDNFAYCLRTGEPLAVTAERGRTARYVLDKMYESVRNGGDWVSV